MSVADLPVDADFALPLPPPVKEGLWEFLRTWGLQDPGDTGGLYEHSVVSRKMGFTRIIC